MKAFRTMTEVELLQTHSKIIAGLRRREVVKTKNNPVGDYTEWLVCNRLSLQMQRNSRAAFDATDPRGIRYQIKGRGSGDKSVQFSSIRFNSVPLGISNNMGLILSLQSYFTRIIPSA